MEWKALLCVASMQSSSEHNYSTLVYVAVQPLLLTTVLEEKSHSKKTEVGELNYDGNSQP